MSAFLGPDQAATEERLIADPDCRPWVEKYQRSRETVSRTDYEVRFIDPYVLAVLGISSSIYSNLCLFVLYDRLT
jgi:hypothetical protein